MSKNQRAVSKSIEKDAEKDTEKDELNIGATALSKVRTGYILLALFIILGFYLRVYHLDYPVIGYHNWKVAHYITEARNFAREGFFKYGFFVPMHSTLESIYEQPDGAHGDTFPSISIVVGLVFKIFGINLVAARLTDIIFSLLAVIAFYFFVRELFEREDLALLSAFLAAINPLFVFFSQNIQLDNISLFFMLLGGYYYVKWRKHDYKTNRFTSLYISASMIVFSVVTKYSFAVIGIPILFTLPYKEMIKHRKRYMLPILITLLILAAFPAWYLYGEHVKKTIFGKGLPEEQLSSITLLNVIDLRIIFDGSFWNTMRSFAADNYSLLGLLFFLWGVVAFVFITADKENRNYGRFKAAFLPGFAIALILTLIGAAGALFNNPGLQFNMSLGYLLLAYFTLIGTAYLMVSKNFKLSSLFTYGSFAGIVAFMVIMGYKLNGHNYHQFPIAPFIIMMIAYFILTAAANISNFAKGNKAPLKIAAIIAIIFLLPVPGSSLYYRSMEGKDRMFDTQFPGLDIAGNYINTHSQPNERLFHSGHQSFGVLWAADRRGYKSPINASYFQEAEDKYNVSWVLVYQWGVQNYCLMPGYFGLTCNDNQKSVQEYLYGHYRLVQAGFRPLGQGVQPLWFLFRKGGSFNETEINSLLNNKPVMDTNYNFIQSGIVPLTYTQIPDNVKYINVE